MKGNQCEGSYVEGGTTLLPVVLIYCLWSPTQPCQPAWPLMTFSKNYVYFSSQILYSSPTGSFHIANFHFQLIWILRSSLQWREEPQVFIGLMKIRWGETSPWRNLLKSSHKGRNGWNTPLLLYQHIKHFWC